MADPDSTNSNNTSTRSDNANNARFNADASSNAAENAANVENFENGQYRRNPVYASKAVGSLPQFSNLILRLKETNSNVMKLTILISFVCSMLGIMMPQALFDETMRKFINRLSQKFRGQNVDKSSEFYAKALLAYLEQIFLYNSIWEVAVQTSLCLESGDCDEESMILKFLWDYKISLCGKEDPTHTTISNCHLLFNVMPLCMLIAMVACVLYYCYENCEVQAQQPPPEANPPQPPPPILNPEPNREINLVETQNLNTKCPLCQTLTTIQQPLPVSSPCWLCWREEFPNDNCSQLHILIRKITTNVLGQNSAGVLYPNPIEPNVKHLVQVEIDKTLMDLAEKVCSDCGPCKRMIQDRLNCVRPAVFGDNVEGQPPCCICDSRHR